MHNELFTNVSFATELTEGHIMTIVASVVLVFITTCYSLICIIEKLCGEYMLMINSLN